MGTLVLAPAHGQVLYRTVGRSEARAHDFGSARDKQRPRKHDEPYVDHLGVSMFASEDLARENAVRFPKIIAAVRLAPGRGFTVARTYADIEGHFSVWGEPADLLDHVAGQPRRFDATTMY